MNTIGALFISCSLNIFSQYTCKLFNIFLLLLLSFLPFLVWLWSILCQLLCQVESKDGCCLYNPLTQITKQLYFIYFCIFVSLFYFLFFFFFCNKKKRENCVSKNTKLSNMFSSHRKFTLMTQFNIFLWHTKAKSIYRKNISNTYLYT